MSAHTHALLTPELSAGWHIATQRRRVLLLALFAFCGSIAAVVLVLLFQVLSAVTLLTWVLMLAIAWRPLIGLMVAFSMVLLFEGGGADQLMAPGGYFLGSLQSIGLTGAIASPLELLLILIFMVWLGQGIARRRFDFRGGRLGTPMLLFSLALAYGLIRGLLGGGNVNIALWESRFLIYVVVCYVVAANTIRRYWHVRMLNGLALVCMGLFAAEAAYRRVALIDTGHLGLTAEFAYSHDSVVLLGLGLLLVLAQSVFGAPLWQRLLGVAVLPACGFAMLATERRAGYIALMIAFLAYGLVFLMAHRKAFVLIVVPVLVATAIYLPLFWNNTTMIGQPARAVRSLSQPDPRDAASNLYRDLELINVKATIHSNSLLGVGFGRPFDFVVSLPDLSWWPFWHFEPHHNILWVWLKLGAAGFVIFFTLMGAGIAWSAHCAKALKRPETRVLALLALAGIVSTLAFSYVDLGLVSGRITVFLGTTLGSLSVLDQLQD